MKQIKLTCRIEKKNDHYSLKLPEDYKKAMHSLMKFCFEKKGGFCSFSIAPPRKPRSTGKGSQNHHLNSHIQQISLFTGQPFDSIKIYVKSEAVSIGYPILKNNKGEDVSDNRGNILGQSETDCSVEECSLLITQVHHLADEYNIRLIEE